MLRLLTVRCYVDVLTRLIVLPDPGLSDPVLATGGLSDPSLDACGVSTPGLSDPCHADRASCLVARGLSDPGLSNPFPTTGGLSDPCRDACLTLALWLLSLAR